MSRSYWPLILVLAAAWGASYLFIKVAVEGGLSPGALMAARALLAAIVLLGYLATTIGIRSALAGLRASWREAVFLGAFNAAVPFWLVAWGETHIESGTAAIAQATVPIASVVIGLPFLAHERIGRVRGTGIGVGLIGVAVVAGIAPAGDAWAIAGTLAVVLASVSYAGAGVYGQLRVRGSSGPILAAGSMVLGGLMLLPLAVADAPDEVPTAKAIASLLALTLIGTVVAQLILFRTLRLFGARRQSLVAYLMPGFALLYGWLLLDESASAAELLGLGLILVGVALGSGTVRLRR